MSEKQRKKHIILIEIRSEYNEKHLPLMIRNFKKLNKEIQENACQLLSDKVVPFFEENGLRLQRILTDRGTEYCGNIDRHEYQLFLANKGIKHTRTKPRSPHGICERFNRTFKDEFLSIKLRSEMYSSREEFQQDADIWLNYYNIQRAHSGKYCNGKTPIKTFIDSVDLAKNYYIEKENKRENIEKENENYILRYPDFMFANYGQRNEK